MNFRTMQAANRRKTFGLLAGMGLLTGLVAYAALTYFGSSGAAIVPVAVGIALIGVWGSYYGSDKLVLTMTGAKLIQESDNPKLFGLVQEVCIASGLKVPKIAIVVDPAPNAFATGRNPEHALIAFTTGILDVMDRDELQGVIAHEMSHVANRDTLVSAVAATTAGAIAILSDVLTRMMWFGGGRRDRDSNSNPLLIVFSLLDVAIINNQIIMFASIHNTVIINFSSGLFRSLFYFMNKPVFCNNRKIRKCF